MKVAVMGAGAFGTALAICLAQSQPVALWARNKIHVAAMARSRCNERRLPGAAFPEALEVVTHISHLKTADAILLAVPMQRLRSVVQDQQEVLQNKTLVACCKGIELQTGLGPEGILAQELPSAVPAILTGPSFARDIAAGLPTALTLACRDAACGATLQELLHMEHIRLYRTTDTRGAELGGALKNVMAIACGAAMGAGLGESARAALITRGYAEMQRMALKLGAEHETLAGLSGFGDLTLTCTSEQSRNYSLGVSIGAGTGFDAAITVEGAATARAVRQMAQLHGVDMPICDVVVRLLDREIDTTEAMNLLLHRPLREE